jgi:hypothetical protein
MGINYEKPVDVTPVMNNIIPPMDQLHDPDSKLFPIIEQAVEKNSIIIIDISLLDSHNALNLSSMIISKFFRKNQREFTTGSEELKRITFVVEEAQSVIGGTTNVSRFVELAKEGRKYQLGGIFITQQPGSISMDILSQGDNFFVFHLLSKDDLKALQKANAHFSNDIVTQILSEPIPGKSYMWSSHQPFVIPVRIKNFEELVEPHKAKAVQSNNNLLMPILTQITQFDEIERVIISKFLNVLDTEGLNLDDRKTLFSDDIKKQITTGTFKKLEKEETDYLNKKGYLARGRENKKPYALSYIYLGQLYEKALIHNASINTSEINKNIQIRKKKSDKEIKTTLKEDVNIKKDPKKGDYVDGLFYCWETDKAVKFSRKKDNLILWIPKSIIENSWLNEKTKAQKVYLNFIPDEFSWKEDRFQKKIL